MSNRSKIIPLILVAAIFVGLFMPSGVFAAAGECGAWPSSWGNCLIFGLRMVLEILILPLMSFIVYLGGSILDWTITQSLNTTWFAGIAGIKTGWAIIRDLINITFIFLVLYSAIAMILDVGKYNAKQMIRSIIIAALLINFSLFTARVVMDAGNVVAHGVYNRISGEGAEKQNVGVALMNLLHMQTLWSSDNAKKILEDPQTAAPEGAELGKEAGLFLNAAMRIILLGFAVYIFFNASFLFIARILAFIFLMVFAPVGFIGSVIPGASGAASKWWDHLFHQTLVAPVFLILIYIAFTIAQEIGDKIAPVMDTGGSGIQIGFFFNYVIVIGLFWLALKITRGLSGELGAQVTKWGKIAGTVVAGAGLAAGVGVTAVAGRAVVGRLAAGAAASETGLVGGTLKGMASKEGAGLGARFQRAVGQAGLTATNRLADASYDVRTSKLFQKGAGKLGLVSGAQTLGLTLKKKPSEEKKDSDKVYGYREAKENKAEQTKEKAVDMAKYLSASKYNEEDVKRKAGVNTASAKIDEVKKKAEEAVRKGDTSIPEVGAVIAKEQNLRRTAENLAKAKRELEEEKRKEETAKTRLAEAVRTGGDIRTAEDELKRSQERQKELSKSGGDLERYNKDVEKFTKEVTAENTKLFGVIATNMGKNFSELERNLSEAEVRAKEQSEKLKTTASERVERYATQITERQTTPGGIGAAAKTTAKYAVTGAVAGTLIPGVGTVGGAVIGSVAGAVVGGRALYTGSYQTKEEREKIAEEIRKAHREGKLTRKKKRKGEKKSDADKIKELKEKIKEAKESGGDVESLKAKLDEFLEEEE